MDDFGVKYTGKEHATHLVNALKRHYETTEDWTGTLYAGITLEWDYNKCTVDLSMPGYIEAVLHKFQHPIPRRQQYAPYKMQPKQYGVKVQMTDPLDNTPKLPPNAIKTCYYTMVEPSMPPS